MAQSGSVDGLQCRGSQRFMQLSITCSIITLVHKSSYSLALHDVKCGWVEEINGDCSLSDRQRGLTTFLDLIEHRTLCTVKLSPPSIHLKSITSVYLVSMESCPQHAISQPWKKHYLHCNFWLLRSWGNHGYCRHSSSRGRRLVFDCGFSGLNSFKCFDH